MLGGIAVLGGYLYSSFGKPVPAALDYKQAVYTIDGVPMRLYQPGTETAPTDLVYFGNEVSADLDGDGRVDMAFIVSRQTSPKDTVYYAVAALRTESGYVGSDGYLLGTNIAPQSTFMSQYPRHKDVVVFAYADRPIGAVTTDSPSVGKSVFLKIDPSANRWAIVLDPASAESL